MYLPGFIFNKDQLRKDKDPVDYKCHEKCGSIDFVEIFVI